MLPAWRRRTRQEMLIEGTDAHVVHV